MSIRELIPGVVEEVICGVEEAQRKGCAVFPPEVIEIEAHLSGDVGLVRVKVPLFPTMREEEVES